MKKAGLFVISLLLLISIFSFVASSTPASAQFDGTQTPEEVVSQQLGVKPETIEKIPKTPEEIRNAYLKQEWGKIIEKVPVIGSIHKFSLVNPLPFKIAFAEPYSFSLVFFMILVLWVLAAINATKLTKAIGIINPNLCWIAGILIAVIIAQTKLYSFITNSILAIVFSNDAWWVRMIIWTVVAGILVLVNYFGGAISTSLKEWLKKRKEDQEKAKLKQKVETVEAFVKGVEEGSK